MRSFLIVSLIGLAGCASGGGGAGPDVSQTVRVSGGAGTNVALNTVASTSANSASVPIPIDRVWKVLPSVFDSLGIRLTMLDAATRTIGNQGMQLRRKLGSAPLSRYINCGQAQGSESADSYEVHASILTQLTPNGSGGTTITTIVDASARPITVSGDYTSCATNAVLEPLIVSMVKARS